MATYRIYPGPDVLTMARERVAFLFAEFDNVCVGFSGGKDSTVVLHLALEEAERLGRLPLDVLFVDQEAEWQATVDHVRETFDDPRIRGHWLQVPMLMFNATSQEDEWLTAWDPDREADWVHPAQPDAIRTNDYGADRFHDMFDAFPRKHYPDEPFCMIGGVRASESPTRALGLTGYATWKGETWGKQLNKRRKHVAMYPIYDWDDTDVWKAIHDNEWRYCRLYDLFYQYGTPLRDMRLSNVIHETGTRALTFLQEFEGETWSRIQARLAGVNTVKHLGHSKAPRTLPPMFEDWVEYRDHLLANLITDPDHREAMAADFDRIHRLFGHNPKIHARFVKAEISAILNNDYHGTKLSALQAQMFMHSVNYGKRSTGDRALVIVPDAK